MGRIHVLIFGLMVVASSMLFWCASISLAAEIELEALSDIDFGEVPPSIGDLMSQTSFCVALSERGNYQISAFTNAPGSRFVLLGADQVVAHGVAFEVFVSESGGGRGAQLLPGVPITGLRSRERLPNGDCRRPQPQITVTIRGGELSNARPGIYRGSLGLTVAPE